MLTIPNQNDFYFFLMKLIFISEVCPSKYLKSEFEVGGLSSSACIIRLLVLQISRLSEGSTGQIFATSSVIYQMKMWGL